MAISYPLDPPTSPGVESVTFKAAVSVGVGRSPFTFKTFVHRHAGQVWGASVSLPALTRAQADEWEAWLLSLNGQAGTFWLGDPTRKSPRGAALGVPSTENPNPLGQQALNTIGWTASTAGILVAGDFIQVGQRLYRVLKDVPSDINGRAQLDIFPSLRESPANGTTVVTQSPRGLFRLASNVYDIFRTRESKFYEVSFEAVEAI